MYHVSSGLAKTILQRTAVQGGRGEEGNESVGRIASLDGQG